MKKLLLVFVGLLCSLVISAQTNFQELSLEKAREQARAENKPIFLDCYTSWCGPCKMLSFVLKDVEKEFGDDLTILKVDFDQNKDLTAEYGVTGYPTLVLLKDGAEVGRLQGLQQKPVIIKLVKDHQ